MSKEIRSFQDSQLRIAPDSNGRKLIGLAIPYNSLSSDLGGFRERFLPGSVTRSIKGGNIAALFNHDTSKPLASQKSGNLRLTEKADGVHVEIDLPEGVSYADDLRALMAHGEGTGMSFGFNPKDVNWTKEQGTNIAEVRDADVGEVSPLASVQPAYSATSIALRSIAEGEQADAAERYGIDLDKLAGVFLAIKRGLPLSEVETEVMQQARCLFADVRKPLLEAAEKKAMSILL